MFQHIRKHGEVFEAFEDVANTIKLFRGKGRDSRVIWDDSRNCPENAGQLVMAITWLGANLVEFR
jgi:hypothetical protein